MKKNITKILCPIMALSLLLPLSGCSDNAADTEETTAPAATAVQTQYTDEAEKLVKQETVYVNLSSGGSVQNTVVTDWLHTDSPCVRVKDKSDLDSIVNVKGTEVPETDGENLIWNMSSTDLYYRGYSQKELPVDFEIKYYYNGVEVEPESFLGCQGQLKIEIKLKNKSVKSVDINGSKVNICEPMLVVGGMILNESQFSAIKLTNGKSIGDGAKQIAVFVGLPGMSDSLGFSKAELSQLGENVFGGVNFSDEFALEANIDHCTLGNMYFAVLPFSSLKGAAQLDGTLSGIAGVMNSLSEISNAVYNIDPDKLIETLMNNSDKITELADMINEARELYTENKALLDIVSSQLTPENIAQIKAVIGDLEQLDTEKYVELLSSEEMTKVLDDIKNTDFSKYASLIKNPLFKAFFSDLSTLASDANAVMPQLESIAQDIESGAFNSLLQDCEELAPVFEALSNQLSTPEAQQALQNLPQTAEKIQSMLSVLQENEELLNSLGTAFSDENISALTAALKSSENISINAIMDSVNRLTANPQDTTARLKAMSEFADENKIFSAAAENTETGVVFVFRTEAVK